MRSCSRCRRGNRGPASLRRRPGDCARSRALWTPLSHRAALDIVVKARQLEVAGFQQSVDAYTARLAVVRDPAWRAKRLKEAQQAAATMPNPQAFIKQIEESIGIEEATLVKELSPRPAPASGWWTRGRRSPR